MNTPVDRMLESVRVMPSIPKALQQIMESLNNPNSTVEDITEPLSHDPALTAKVLRMSNTAHYGLPRQVAAVEEAVLLVGVEAVRTMVIASGLVGAFDAIKGFDMKRFWRLSLLSGAIARDLAKKTGLVNSEHAYTAALMHGLGVLAIHGAFPDSSLQIDKSCTDQDVHQRAILEMNYLGFHHGHIGEKISTAWHLPEQIGKAIRFYPNPEMLNAPVLALVVFSALALAIDLEDEKPVDQWGQAITNQVLQRMKIDRNVFAGNEQKWTEYRESTDSIVS
ncbi:MAG: HDOD domain-containing protein [Limnobacter sp.]|nr:HDOD domain-containing protein [Limnobacter sp.]